MEKKRRILLLEINPGLTIVGVMRDLVLGSAMSMTFSAYGGIAPYRWTLSGDLPDGLSWDASTATLSGTPTVPGSFPITITLQDSQRTVVQKAFLFRVVALPLTISGEAPDAQVGDTLNFDYTANGGVPPYTFTVQSGALPAGGSLSTAGHLGGTVTTPETATPVIRVTDSAFTTADLVDSITIAPATLALSGTYPSGTVGVSYSHDLTISGGVGPYTLTGGTGLASGTLPAGLSLSIVGSALRLSGTPTASATSGFTASVDSADAQTATSSQSVAIAGVPVTWNPSDKDALIVLANSNQDAGGSSFVSVRSDGSQSAGKFYLEIEKLSSGANTIVVGFGKSTASLSSYPGNDANAVGFQIDFPGGPYMYQNGAQGVPGSMTGQTCSSAGDRAMLAVDATTGQVWIGIKGTFDGNPAAGTGATFTFAPGTALFVMGGLSSNPGIRIHSGQDAFSYSVPSGFTAGFYA